MVKKGIFINHVDWLTLLLGIHYKICYDFFLLASFRAFVTHS